jgi:hypothetical protein
VLDRAGEENRNTIVIAGPDCALRVPQIELAPMLDGENIATALQAMSFRAA